MDLLGLANYAVFMAILIGIYALLALGLNIQWGFTGLFNAGIAGFFAVGAYTSAILTSLPATGRAWPRPSTTRAPPKRGRVEVQIAPRLVVASMAPTVCGMLDR